MKKTPAKNKAAVTPKPKAARDYFPPVPPDHPIYQSGYVLGGRYPALKKQPTEREELDRIASELAMKHNADPVDEDFAQIAQWTEQP